MGCVPLGAHWTGHKIQEFVASPGRSFSAEKMWYYWPENFSVEKLPPLSLCFLSFRTLKVRKYVWIHGIHALKWTNCLKMKIKYKIWMQFQIKITEFQDLHVPVCLRNWLKCSTWSWVLTALGSWDTGALGGGGLGIGTILALPLISASFVLARAEEKSLLSDANSTDTYNEGQGFIQYSYIFGYLVNSTKPVSFQIITIDIKQT